MGSSVGALAFTLIRPAITAGRGTGVLSMTGEQRGARLAADNRGLIGNNSHKVPTRRERLMRLAEICRSINPADIRSIQQAGSGFVATMANGSKARVGCW